jgi:hypothetical protein
MSLVRGGLRTVTGLIGRSNKQSYKLQTATATIGIRGTGFLATSSDDGTRVRVSEGAVALCNAAGCLNLDSLQSGFSPNTTSLPVRIAQAPALQPVQAPSVMVLAPIENLPTVVDVPLETETQSPRVPLTSPGTESLLLIGKASVPIFSGTGSGTLNFDAEGRLLEIDYGMSGYLATPAIISDFGSDGVIAWGRWNGGVGTIYSNPTGPSLSYLTYITGNIGAAVPITGSYTVIGSTSPMVVDSLGGVSQLGTPNSVTGGLNVNFTGPSGGSLSYNLNIPVAGHTFSMIGTANQSGSFGTQFLGSTVTITSTGSACSSTCVSAIPSVGAIQGAFFGAGNTRAGAQYGFSSTLGTVTGAVVFKKD